MTDYTFQLSDAELERYRAMAAHALSHEQALWTAAGLTPGTHVVDLGCGPGTFLAHLAERTGPDGQVTGVDNDNQAVRAVVGARACRPGSAGLLPASLPGG